MVNGCSFMVNGWSLMVIYDQGVAINCPLWSLPLGGQLLSMGGYKWSAVVIGCSQLTSGYLWSMGGH